MNGAAASQGRVADPALAFLVVVALAGTLGLGFIGYAPNRIVSPATLPLWSAAGPVYLAALAGAFALMAVGAAGSTVAATSLALAGAVLLLLADLATAGAAASALLRQAGGPAARASLGGAFWLILAVAFLAILDLVQRLALRPLQRVSLGVAVFALVALLAMSGWFDDLSIIREWANRREEYGAALGQHLRLVVSALLLALTIGVPLGLSAAGSTVRSRRIFTVLSLIQTIPSIALFGLLIGPLSSLSEAVPALRDIGVRGIGFTPALIALTLYGLLPIARNTEAGIRGVPAAAIDAARGMGMTRLQRTVRVALPLALPSLVAGLRIVTVQLVGLTVVAALIGAGGFGSFVFVGLGQTATDLVLLGALSAILLALAADAVLRLLVHVAEARVAG